jgi:hypothetical protein
MESLTLEQAYYIGELVAAFMVIISIFYLGMQVKQNNISTRLDSVQKINSNFSLLWEAISENGEVADIYYRGMNGYGQLENVEKMRFTALLNRIMRVVQGMYYERQQGVVDDILWSSFQAPLNDAFQLQGYLEYWELKRHWFDEEFQDHIRRVHIEAKDTKLLYPTPDS